MTKKRKFRQLTLEEQRELETLVARERLARGFVTLQEPPQKKAMPPMPSSWTDKLPEWLQAFLGMMIVAGYLGFLWLWFGWDGRPDWLKAWIEFDLWRGGQI